LLKGISAAATGSAAMLAETFHSAADTGNEALLLLGMRAARRFPDELEHEEEGGESGGEVGGSVLLRKLAGPGVCQCRPPCASEYRQRIRHIFTGQCEHATAERHAG
jgi:cation efflux family protein